MERLDYKNYIPYLKHIEVYFFVFFIFVTEVGQRLPDNNWRILLYVNLALWRFKLIILVT